MKQSRSVGLDILRVFAAILVIICHSGYFSVGISYSFLSFAGVLAVEIFFALSGFLVGKGLIQAVTSQSPGRELKKFYVNRLVRTLPVYYLALLLTALTSGGAVPLSYFVFCQNFSVADLGFLPVSWSLAVEAWFYFLIPPVFFLLVRGFSARVTQERAVFAAIGVLCLIPFALRVIWVLAAQPTWDYGVRKQIPLRLDAIMLGVLLAAGKRYRPEGYRRLAARKACLVVSIVGILVLYTAYWAYLSDDAKFDASPVSKILMFALLPLLCCMLVMYLEEAPRLTKLQGTPLARGICGLSTVSYGVYLLQLWVFTALSPYFTGTRFSVSWLGFLGAIALTVAAAAVVYELVEKPAMKLRDRIVARL